MIDIATRLALTVGALIVAGRALWLIHTRQVATTGRRLSVAVITAAAIPTALFWGYLAATAPAVNGDLRFDAYLSRVKDAWVLIGLYTLLEIILTAERGRRNERLHH